jgi:predicted Zn-dependent protease
MSNLKSYAEDLIKSVLRKKAEQVEVVIKKNHIGVARFKNNAIHQNIESNRPIGPPHNTYSVKLRIIKDKKLGTAFSSSYDKKEIIENAIKSSNYGPEYETFTPPIKAPTLPGLYYKDTAYLEPEERIEGVHRIVNYCKECDEQVKAVGGMLSNLSSKTVIANSLGLEAEHKFTGSHVIVTALAKENGNEGSGYQRQCSRNYYDLDLEQVAEEAAISAISTMGFKQYPVPIGKRTVIFEAEAAAEYLGTLTQMAFSINRTPRTTSKTPLGELVFDEKLTVHDNGRDRRTLQASAIDGEGTPKRDLCLINNGVPENRCYNRDMAKSEGRDTTGHAATPWTGYFWTGTGNGSTYTPTNQIITPGVNSLEDLIYDTRDGVLVRRLRCPAARGQTIMPDIIRADTQECWTIKNGEIIGPANYIRFTDSLIDSMKNIEIGDESTIKQVGSFVIPAMKIQSLNISQPSIVMIQ